MDQVRHIKRILRSQPTTEGAGVRLKRAFMYQRAPELDPFLLLDDFHSSNSRDYIKGFPWHPHRGIETISYMLKGEMEHGDSLGNRGVITAGGVQWMTAGSGIIHQEMPHGESDGQMWGFQLWANLPAAHKMMDPRYQDITPDQVPLITRPDGVLIHLLCGEVDGVQGPVKDIMIDPQYLDVTVPPHTQFTFSVKPGYTVFAYIIAGAGFFEPSTHTNQQARILGPETVVIWEDGENLAITSQNASVRFLLVSGKPIGEPVAWYGPIVMNTQEELRIAFEEYQNGTFLKHANQAS